VVKFPSGLLFLDIKIMRIILATMLVTTGAFMAVATARGELPVPSQAQVEWLHAGAEIGLSQAMISPSLA